jgi:CheY-like chemotaxis protein
MHDTILVVDDERLIRHAIVADLSDAGFYVREAASGAEALKILVAGATVDALLTDIRMPGAVDGWDLAEQARTGRRDLPVIYVTAFSAERNRQVERSVLLKKPMTIEMILGALAHLGLPRCAC